MPRAWECDEWLQFYHAALLELNLQKLPIRIEAANKGIRARLRELSNSNAGDCPARAKCYRGCSGKSAQFDQGAAVRLNRERKWIMNTGSSKSADGRDWRGFYKAALFEVDHGKQAQRIVEAEKALVVRARELFHASGDNVEEQMALDDAMYALHALSTTKRSRANGENDGSQEPDLAA